MASQKLILKRLLQCCEPTTLMSIDVCITMHEQAQVSPCLACMCKQVKPDCRRHVCLHACIHVYLYIYIYVYTNVYICIYSIYIYMYVCNIHTHRCACICTRAYIKTFVHSSLHASVQFKFVSGESDATARKQNIDHFISDFTASSFGLRA